MVQVKVVPGIFELKVIGAVVLLSHTVTGGIVAIEGVGLIIKVTGVLVRLLHPSLLTAYAK